MCNCTVYKVVNTYHFLLNYFSKLPSTLSFLNKAVAGNISADLISLKFNYRIVHKHYIKSYKRVSQ